MSEKQTVPAESFVDTLKANVDNAHMTDVQFRSFIRNTLTIVKSGLIYPEDVRNNLN